MVAPCAAACLAASAATRTTATATAATTGLHAARATAAGLVAHEGVARGRRTQGHRDDDAGDDQPSGLEIAAHDLGRLAVRDADTDSNALELFAGLIPHVDGARERGPLQGREEVVDSIRVALGDRHDRCVRLGRRATVGA